MAAGRSNATSQPSSRSSLAHIRFDANLRTSLVHLPVTLYAPLTSRNVPPQSIVVELEHVHTGAKYYAGWSGMSSAPASPSDVFTSMAGPSATVDPATGSSITAVLTLSPLLADLIDPQSPLTPESVVRITLLRSPPLPTAKRIDVTPLTPDDWEILSIHADEVEGNMLGQIRAAKAGMTIGVCVGRAGRTVCKFLVDTTDPFSSAAEGVDSPAPARAVRLSTDTEVVIAPKLRPSNAIEPAESHELSAPVPTSKATSTSAAAAEEARKALSTQLWRVLPSSWVTPTASASSPALYTRDAILVPPQKSSSALLLHAFPNRRCAITKVPCPIGVAISGSTDSSSSTAKPDSSSLASSPKNPHNLPVRPTTSADFIDGGSMYTPPAATSRSSWPRRHVWMGPDLRTQLGVNDWDLVRFSPAPPGASARVNGATGTADGEDDRQHDSDVAKSNQARLAGVEEALESCTLLAVDTFRTRELQSLASQLSEQSVAPHQSSPEALASAEPWITASSRAAVTQSASRQARAGPSGLLLVGSSGSGRTSVARAVASRVSERCLARTVWIECAPHAEERAPALRTLIASWLATAAWHSPSVLVLEDVDRLAPAEVEHADSTRSRQVAEALLASIRTTCARHDVFVLMTALGDTSAHALLSTGRIITKTVKLRPPDKRARREILQELVRRKVEGGEKGDETSTQGELAASALQAPDLNYVTLAGMTEGYLPADLRDLVERTVHSAAVRSASSALSSKASGEGTKHLTRTRSMSSHSFASSSNNHSVLAIRSSTPPVPTLNLTLEDFTAAQQGFTPLSLRDVSLATSSVAWSDIGGLTATRAVLRETLEWPTKYAQIFASCPLRLRSGLLLYGYPGCGKTLLASAVAKECGLNFISVKGPEILNKYIGASEKSVRDLFDRAQAARPCVLFFDEFDSIAPKRGHDSTGVTDRVVNQLLTQMDGAEGLEGVYVLAATSRPDLIDAALLRPGRLDKSLLCDMPNEQDRVDILQAVARKIRLHEEVDLRAWASRTQGFSGADLQALLYNAHLDTIHQSITAAKEGNGSGTKEEKETGTVAGLQFVKLEAAGAGKGKGKGKEVASGKEALTNGDEGAAAPAVVMSGAERQALERRMELVLSNARSGITFTTSSGKSAPNVSLVSSAAPAHTLVTNAAIERSLRSTRPSVPPEEVRRLQAIYDRFRGERSGEFRDGSGSSEVGARESLM